MARQTNTVTKITNTQKNTHKIREAPSSAPRALRTGVFVVGIPTFHGYCVSRPRHANRLRRKVKKRREEAEEKRREREKACKTVMRRGDLMTQDFSIHFAPPRFAPPRFGGVIVRGR